MTETEQKEEAGSAPETPSGQQAEVSDPGAQLIIDVYEQMFSERYTETDAEYSKNAAVALSPPPCVENWYSRPKRSWDSSRGNGRGRGQHGQWDRREGYGSRGGYGSHGGQGHRAQDGGYGSYDRRSGGQYQDSRGGRYGDQRRGHGQHYGQRHQPYQGRDQFRQHQSGGYHR